MNRYRVVPSWNELGTAKEVIVAASYFKSSTFDGKPITEFYCEGAKQSPKDDELLAIFWGEIIVIKL